jgi:hypothetical protein
MLRNNKGLSSGLLAIMVILFSVALTSLFVNLVWDHVNDSFQGLDESVADNTTKQQIDDLTSMIDWSDKLFMGFLIVLIIGYLISAATIPTDEPITFILFMFFLLISIFLSMVLSNVWVTISNQASLLTSLGDLPLTNYVLTFYPTIIFFVGVIGALIFFTRRKNSGGSTGGFDGDIGGADFE